MKHLTFVEKLDKLGIAIRSTITEGESRKFEIADIFRTKILIKTGQNLQWEDKLNREDPFKAFIKLAIDMDTWKHSWHIDIEPENYEQLRDIIQKKILDKAEKIDILMNVYFHLQSEMSKIDN